MAHNYIIKINGRSYGQRIIIFDLLYPFITEKKVSLKSFGVLSETKRFLCQTKKNKINFNINLFAKQLMKISFCNIFQELISYQNSWV